MTDTPTKKQLKEFGYLVGFGLPILIGWLIPSLIGHGFRPWTLWIGIPALILGFVAPALLKQPYRAWMALGHALGWVNSHIILGLVFIVVLQPIAYVMRLFGHDPLRRKKDNGGKSYREERNSLMTNFTRIF